MAALYGSKYAYLCAMILTQILRIWSYSLEQLANLEIRLETWSLSTLLNDYKRKAIGRGRESSSQRD